LCSAWIMAGLLHLGIREIVGSVPGQGVI